ncbi:MAG: DUF6089 family protein [Bacteroidota bacterium]
MKTTPVALLLWALPLFVCAQAKLEMGLFLGGANYQGDLVPSNGPLLSETNPAVGLFTRIRLSDHFALKSLAAFGQISGADTNFDEPHYASSRNAAFTNSIIDLTVQLEWSPFVFNVGSDSLGRSKAIRPYLFSGIGALYSNPQYSTTAGELIPEILRSDFEEDYTGVYPSIPLGGGITFPLGNKVNFGLEAGVRYSFMDFFDGIHFAGNPDGNDWLWFGGANVSIKFVPKDSDKDGVPDKDDRCPWAKGSVLAKGCPDADNDGVEDAEDLCPDQPGPILLNGCPDSDGDEIPDISDACPTGFGFEDTDGCPDRDNDCIPDKDDLCPDVEGLLVYGGCADIDGDSIPDPEDNCPEEMGLAINGGCPFMDTDCDGILDKDDQCPNVASEEGFTGCPDADYDEVPDKDDACPESAGTKELNGCPELAENVEEVLSLATKNIQFRTGSSQLLSTAKKELDKIVELLREYPDYELYINGYTDNQGRASSNLNLSKSRAKACYEYILEKGFDYKRLHFEGFGESDPIANNATSEGRRLNRRVEFEMKLIDK